MGYQNQLVRKVEQVEAVRIPPKYLKVFGTISYREMLKPHYNLGQILDDKA